MESFNDQQISEILIGFENQQLQKEKWTHAAHLIVSLHYCLQNPKDKVLELLREKISGYNEATGTANTDSSGYHETLTVFWIEQTNQFLLQCQLDNFTDICNTFINSDYGSKTAPFQFYTKDLLLSKKARKEWIKPNLLSS